MSPGVPPPADRFATEAMRVNETDRENGHDRRSPDCERCKRAQQGRCQLHRVEDNHSSMNVDDYRCPTCGVWRSMREGEPCVPCKSDHQRVLPDGSVEFVEVSDR
jgi:hypothetical protein